MNEPSAWTVSAGIPDDLDRGDVSDQYQWRCSCGKAGEWTDDREAALQSGGMHVLERGHWGQVWLEVIGAFTGGNNSTVTVSGRSTDDHLPDIPGFEGAPAVTSTATDADFAGIDLGVGHDRAVIVVKSTRRDFETIHVPDDWTPEEIGTALERAKASGRRGVTLVVGDPERLAESMDGLQRAIGDGLAPAISVVARGLVECLHRLRARGRRSRQNRSARARAARRLAIRTGHAPAPASELRGMKLELGGAARG